MIQQSSGWHTHGRTEVARDALDQETVREGYFWQSRATAAGRRAPPVQPVDLRQLARDIRKV